MHWLFKQISQLAMFYSLKHFNHHRRPSSGTEWSLLARWRGEQTPTRDLVCSSPHLSPHLIVGSVFLIQMASFIQRAHLFVSLSITFSPSLVVKLWNLFEKYTSNLMNIFTNIRPLTVSSYQYNYGGMFVTQLPLNVYFTLQMIELSQFTPTVRSWMVGFWM